MKVIKKMISIVFILAISVCQAQTVGDVLKAVVAKYGMPAPFQYKSTYVLYKDAESNTVEETYKGIFLKNAANEVYMKINNSEIISLKAASLKISHSEKSLIIAKPIANYNGDFDVSKLLDICTVRSFRDLKSYWEIILLPKENAGLPFSRIIVQVGKDHFIKKQTFYYNTAMNFSKNNKPDFHYPRLEIIHEGHSRKIVNEKVFKSSSYYTLTPKKSIVLAENIKKYEIIDQRAVSNNIK